MIDITYFRWTSELETRDQALMAYGDEKEKQASEVLER